LFLGRAVLVAGNGGSNVYKVGKENDPVQRETIGSASSG